MFEVSLDPHKKIHVSPVVGDVRKTVAESWHVARCDRTKM